MSATVILAIRGLLRLTNQKHVAKISCVPEKFQDLNTLVVATPSSSVPVCAYAHIAQIDHT